MSALRLPGVARRRWRNPSDRRSDAARSSPATAEDAVDGVGQCADVSRWDEQGAGPGHLLHGRPRRGDQGGATGQRLQGGQAEALVQRRIDDGRRRAEQGRDDPSSTYPVRTIRRPRPDDATAASTASPPHPRPPASTSRASGWRPATAAKARDQGRHVLAGLERPHEHQRAAGPRSGGRRRRPAGRRPHPGEGSSGRNRSVSTPWGATTTSASTSHHRPRPSAVTWLGQTTTAASSPPARWPAGRGATLDRSCHSGASKKLRSWTVTTDGTGDHRGIV